MTDRIAYIIFIIIISGGLGYLMGALLSIRYHRRGK